MKIITPSLEIKKNEGFHRDLLRRESFGKSLKNLIVRSEDALVISLDGEWGEGKTTFVKMWQGLLNKEKIPNIYINSFANDYVEDPFISIASAITSYVESNAKNKNTKKLETYKNVAVKVGKNLLWWGAKTAVKTATLGAINESGIEELQNVGSDIASDASSAIDKLIENKLSSYQTDVELFETFRTTLSEIPKELKNNNPESPKPLVMIIDELDRCRPTYAVELIEKVKHLFSVPNVVFVLVMHKKQLERSVQNVYGDIDAHTYLQKFINVETALPKLAHDSRVNDIEKYCEQVFDAHDIEIKEEKDKKNILTGVTALAEFFKLSLRQIERVFTNIAVFYASSDDKRLWHTAVICFLSVIKITHPDTYQRLAENSISYEELINKLGINDVTPDDKDVTSRTIRWIKYLMLSDDELNNFHREDPTIKGYLNTIAGDRKSIIPECIRKTNLFSVKPQ